MQRIYAPLPLASSLRWHVCFLWLCSLAADGAEGPPEDSELAGLLGVLGVDAYTHDQLVAKDEGEEVQLPVQQSKSYLTKPSNSGNGCDGNTKIK